MDAMIVVCKRVRRNIRVHFRCRDDPSPVADFGQPLECVQGSATGNCFGSSASARVWRRLDAGCYAAEFTITLPGGCTVYAYAAFKLK